MRRFEQVPVGRANHIRSTLGNLTYFNSFVLSLDRPPWAIIGGTIGAAVVVIIVLLVALWVHKKRKCVKDTKSKY